jgi:putative aminopeptidase FrvX
MVTFVDAKGFLRVSPLGGVFARRRGPAGGIRGRDDGSDRIEKWLQAAETPAWDKMFVDIGAKSAEGCRWGSATRRC